MDRTNEEQTEELNRLRARVVELEKYRKSSEKNRKAREKQFRGFRKILRSSGPAFGQFQETFTYVNRTFEQLTGYTRDELREIPYTEIFHPGYRDLIRDNWEVRASGENKAAPKRFECKIVTSAGEEKWVDIWIQIARFSGVRAGLATLFDITDRKTAEEALKRSEERYRSIFEHSRDAIYITTKDGQFIDVNKAALDLLGYAAEEAQGIDANTLYLNPEDRHTFQESIRKEGFVRDFELKMRRKDGTILDCLLTASVRYGSDKSIRGYQGIVRDITERKRTERELVRLAAFPNENPSPVLESRSDGTIEYVNPACHALMAKIGAGDLNAILPAEHEKLVTECLENERSVYDVKVRTHDRTLSWSYHAVTAARVVHLYGVDVTDLERAAKERQELERQMQHMQKLESLGVLAGGIAHDFNNLLTGILGNASLARGRLKAESPARRNVEEIEKVAQRATELTKQMLAYSGKGKFIVQPLNLNFVVEEMSELFRTLISKKAKVEYDFSEDLPPIEGDVTQVEQVIMNLITNGSEALDGRAGTIRISTGTVNADRVYLTSTFLTNELPEGVYVYVEVSDTGIGMDKETVSKIFDPFFTTKASGRGLGLAAVLGIMRDHKGALKIYTEPGRGSTVRVLFPATTEAAMVTRQHSRTSDSLSAGWKGSGVILVVDDEKSVRKLAKDILEEVGYSVLLAENGQHGMEVFSQHANEIVLVLLDLTMPVMGGDEMFARMSQIQPNTPVLLSSGFAEEDAAKRFGETGPAGFVQKPYRAQELIEHVQASLST